MEVTYHRSFLKMYEKLPLKIQRKFEQQVTIFHNDPLNQLLNNHPLQGKWGGFHSIDITGDYRAIYLPLNKIAARFYAIGTHSQLYK